MVTRRAGFMTRHLWVTAFDPAELFAAGRYPNQRAGGDGLPAHVAADRRLDGEDVVLWHSFGLHHIPRPEDFPVQPVLTCGFSLHPDGFFDENPALDIPPSTSKMSCRADWSIFKPCGFARRLGKCGKTKARAVSPSSLSVKRL